MTGLTKGWDTAQALRAGAAAGIGVCRQDLLTLKSDACIYAKQVGWQMLMSDVLEKAIALSFDDRLYKVAPHVVSLATHKTILDFKFVFSSSPVKDLSTWMDIFGQGYFKFEHKPSSAVVSDWDKTAQSLIGSGQKIALAFGVAYKHALMQGKGSAYFSNNDRKAIALSRDPYIKQAALGLGQTEQDADMLIRDSLSNGTALAQAYLADTRAVLERHAGVLKRLRRETCAYEDILETHEKYAQAGFAFPLKPPACA